MFKAIRALFNLLFELTQAVSVDGLVIFQDTLNIGTIFTGTVKDVAQLESDRIGASIIIMLLIIVALSNAYRPPLIMILVIPFVMIGITPGLLVMDAAFGFIALLGIMSLAGMMIKNSVVLLDQINLNIASGMTQYKATVEAAVERLSPVVNAAATTVFGMIPLLGDVFWVAMAVTIMFGLAFGTLLTMLLVPVLYATFYRLTAPAEN